MAVLEVFEGDAALVPTSEGVDMELSGGLFGCDKGLSSAVVLSLFGGNRDDDGKGGGSCEWWANKLDGVDENEALSSRLQYVVTSMPMSTSAIKEAERAAELDLSWLKSEGVCDEVSVSGTAKSVKDFELAVSIIKSGKVLYNEKYALQWEASLSGV